LEEGEMSGRNLASLEMAEESDWVWADKGAVKVGSGDVVVFKASDGADEVAAKVEVLELSA
jgi:sarcosine oxidase/L-pipecolate oxidase